MKRLWAPWRLGYVTQREKSKDCVFCTKPQAGDDRANHIVRRGRHAYVMLNTYPYNNGHVMIAPFAHVSYHFPVLIENGIRPEGGLQTLAS